MYDAVALETGTPPAKVRYDPKWRTMSDLLMPHHLTTVEVLLRIRRLVWDLGGEVIAQWDDGHFRGASKLGGGLVPDGLMIVDVPDDAGDVIRSALFIEADMSSETQQAGSGDRDIATKLNRYGAFLRDLWRDCEPVIDAGIDPALILSPAVLFVTRGPRRTAKMVQVARELHCRMSYRFTDYGLLFPKEPELASGPEYLAAMADWTRVDAAAAGAPIWDAAPRQGLSLASYLMSRSRD